MEKDVDFELKNEVSKLNFSANRRIIAEEATQCRLFSYFFRKKEERTMKSERFTFYLKTKLAKTIWEAIPRGAKGAWLENVLVREYSLGNLDNLIPIEKKLQVDRVWMESGMKTEKKPEIERSEVKTSGYPSHCHFQNDKLHSTYPKQEGKRKPVQPQDANTRADELVKEMDGWLNNMARKLRAKVDLK